MKMPPKSNSYSDNFYTPEYAIEPLVPYLKAKGDVKIWECCSGTGNIVKFLREREMSVFGSDIITGEDFLTSERTDFDVIVTNPPFSLKDKFLKKCFDSGKPFAMLLPLTALEGKFRHSLYRKYGIQIILFNKRINYQGHNGDNGCWFASAWFCYGLNLPNQLNFIEVEETKRLKDG